MAKYCCEPEAATDIFSILSAKVLLAVDWSPCGPLDKPLETGTTINTVPLTKAVPPGSVL
jgi:hypothetical protein